MIGMTDFALNKYCSVPAPVLPIKFGRQRRLVLYMGGILLEGQTPGIARTDSNRDSTIAIGQVGNMRLSSSASNQRLFAKNKQRIRLNVDREEEPFALSFEQLRSATMTFLFVYTGLSQRYLRRFQRLPGTIHGGGRIYRSDKKMSFVIAEKKMLFIEDLTIFIRKPGQKNQMLASLCDIEHRQL